VEKLVGVHDDRVARSAPLPSTRGAGSRNTSPRTIV
jgi:hypothetical protein